MSWLSFSGMHPSSMHLRPLLSLAAAFLLAACSSGTSPTEDVAGTTGATQAFERLEVCETCHERQFQETLQSVKSGYRSISPLFNGLELTSNFVLQQLLSGGLIPVNLRPRYQVPSAPGDPQGDNLVSSTDGYQSNDDIRAGLCIGCHDGAAILRGENLDQREIPEWGGSFDPPVCPKDDPLCYRQVVNARPLRDYHFLDSNGNQILPTDLGGPPPAGAGPSLGAQGVGCDHCHNVQGPDTTRSLQGDGLANMAHQLEFTRIKIGPFDDPLVVGPLPIPGDDNKNFHSASTNPDRINYLRSANFCGACHDVRLPIPGGNLVDHEGDPRNSSVQIFRLENLSTEWETQAYAFADQNPFDQLVRCQDCHMSLFPFGGDATYAVHDEESGRDFEVTSARPAVFPIDKAASGANPTGTGIPASDLPDRQVVTHYFTGIDEPLTYIDCQTAAETYGRTDACIGEMRERIGQTRVDSFQPGVDEHGVPLSINTRRRALLENASRVYLDLTDGQAKLGETFNARVTAIALTGHNFPAGFSQERTVWVKLTVSAKPTAATAGICNDMEFAHNPGVCLNDKATTCTTDADCPGDACGGLCTNGLETCLSAADCSDPGDECNRARSQFCTSDGEFLLYQSGYLIDKPHPETGETAPDGNLSDEDLEHVIAIVNPFTHDNEIFEEGTDNGPAARIFEGEAQGLVLFRNELLRFYGPSFILEPEKEGGCQPFFQDQCVRLVDAYGDLPAGSIVRIKGDEASCSQSIMSDDPSCGTESTCEARATGIALPVARRHPRTGVCLSHVLEEETFSAGLSNTVDNWRSLPPLDPKTFRYEIHLPSKQELADAGVELEGDLHVRAAVQAQHFPPLFLRFLTRSTGAVPYQEPPYGMPGYVIPVDAVLPLGRAQEVGKRGPGDHNYKLVDEKRLDDLMKTLPNVATAERSVPLAQDAGE